MSILSRIVEVFLLGATLFVHSCAGVHVISPQSVENVAARITLGVTTKSEIEDLLGNEHGTENLRWTYNLSDTALSISEEKTGMRGGIFPIAIATTPTNTRALITVHFTENGTVNGLEVARFFNPPFTNDYWYLIKGGTENFFKSAARAGEASNFRVAGFDDSSGRFTLEDGLSKTRIYVTVEEKILHIASINPHGRLTNEYRVFAKRESEFIDKILALTAGQKPAWLEADANTKKRNITNRRPGSVSGEWPVTPSRNQELAPPHTPERTAHSPATGEQFKKTAHLSWKDNSSNEAGFRIYRITGKKKIKIADVGPNVTTYSDKDAPPKACYEIAAFNSAGESPATNKVCLSD